jgi:AraC-like DNA-binding protein
MMPDDLPNGNDARFSSLTDEVTLMQASFTDHAFERHSHEGFSIGLTTFGVQRFRCKGRQHDSQVGDFVLFNPDEDHDGRRGTSDGFRYMIWYIPDAFVRGCLDVDAGLAGQPYFAAPHLTDRDMAVAFSRLTQNLLTNSGETLSTECLVRTFLVKMLQRHGERKRAEMLRPAEAGLVRLTRVKDYIRTYFHRDLTLAELADVAGLSRSHLTRIFGATFNVSPHVYLNAVRIVHAQTLISLGMPLASVAVECGFVDQSHLTRRFKGSVGVAPADWRRMRGSGNR